MHRWWQNMQEKGALHFKTSCDICPGFKDNQMAPQNGLISTINQKKKIFSTVQCNAAGTFTLELIFKRLIG